MLFFLNKSNKTAIKTASQPQVQEKTETLVFFFFSSITHSAASQAASQTSSTLTTQEGGASIPPTVTTESPSPASGLLGGSDSGSGTALPPKENGEIHGGSIKTEQEIKAEQLRQQQLRKQAEAERLAKLKKQQEEAKRKQESKKLESIKPSPEQILDSGNVDKARQQANKEKASQDAERKRAEAALNGRADQEEGKSSTAQQQSAAKKSGKVVIQAGSYGNRQAADAQRAKLAMMGVSAHVVEGEAGDRSVYRVQTGELSSDAAASVRKKLQQNGVQSLTRSVQ